MKLYVGNLPYGYDNNKLEELFAGYGNVLSAKIITDRETNRSKGFGFVEMSDEDAKKAMAETDGKDVEGRPLRVNEAKPMQTNNNNNNRRFRR